MCPELLSGYWIAGRFLSSVKYFDGLSGVHHSQLIAQGDQNWLLVALRPWQQTINPKKYRYILYYLRFFNYQWNMVNSHKPWINPAFETRKACIIIIKKNSYQNYYQILYHHQHKNCYYLLLNYSSFVWHFRLTQ